MLTRLEQIIIQGKSDEYVVLVDIVYGVSSNILLQITIYLKYLAVVVLRLSASLLETRSAGSKIWVLKLTY